MKIKVTAIAAIVLASSLSACDASHDDAPTSDSASAPVAPPSSADIAKANAPKDELDFIQAHVAYRADVNGPNNIAIEAQQDKQAKAWKKVVLALGPMKQWSATVENISTEGRITLELTDGVRVWADVPANGDLFNVIKTLNDRTHQPVFFTGKITQTDVDSTQASDDSAFPTCFEDAMGIQGCEIDLESLKPIGSDGGSSS